MNKYKFMMYAEGGSKTFMGHLMRTVSLAVTFRKYGMEVLFVTSSEDGEKYIHENGFEVILIDELDYSVLADLGRRKKIDGILVDRFGFSKEEHQLLVDEIGFLIQIDDFLYDGPAQLVINSTIDEKPENRGGKWFCGGEYAIVREQFVNSHREIQEFPKRMLLTTGYGDPGNVHMKVLRTVQKVLPDLEVHVIVGGGYKTKEKLRKIADNEKNIVLYENIYDISEVIQKIDFAISAAGTTLYELAAAGVPAIAFSLYDNQLDNIERVAKKGCILSIGWYEDIDYSYLEAQIKEFSRDYEMRKKLSRCGIAWIDGKGNERIAEAVIEELQKNEKNRYCNNKIMEH